jgi:hypothetical protein
MQRIVLSFLGATFLLVAGVIPVAALDKNQVVSSCQSQGNQCALFQWADGSVTACGKANCIDCPAGKPECTTLRRKASGTLLPGRSVRLPATGIAGLLNGSGRLRAERTITRH